MDCDIATSGQLRLLIDTGAGTSLVNSDRIQSQTPVNQEERVTLKGVFGQEKATRGTVRAKLLYQGESHLCKFQLLEETMSVEVDGILGMDFLAGRATIDCIRGKITFARLNTAEVIMTKQGFRQGQGLGKKQQGITSPIPSNGQTGTRGLGYNGHPEMSAMEKSHSNDTIQEAFKMFRKERTRGNRSKHHGGTTAATVKTNAPEKTAPQSKETK